MSVVVVLDAGPIGLVTNPKRSPVSIQCTRWLQSHRLAKSRIILPEIADYEIRRELLRANKQRGLAMLDALGGLLEYLPISTAAMHQAAIFWAEARKRGQPTARDVAIDSDVILAAQAVTLGVTKNVVIATTNVGHLSRFVSAMLWHEIKTDATV